MSPTVGTAASCRPNRSAPIDARSDLYALGCTAYSALTGRPPFVGTVKEIVKGQLTGEPPPFPEGLGVPPGLEQLVLHELLAKDPDLRPADAGALLLALDRIEESSADESEGRGGARPRNRRDASGVVVLILVIVFASVAVIILTQNR
jgi:serine/threonine-protein kinase